MESSDELGVSKTLVLPCFRPLCQLVHAKAKLVHDIAPSGGGSTDLTGAWQAQRIGLLRNKNLFQINSGFELLTYHGFRTHQQA